MVRVARVMSSIALVVLLTAGVAHPATALSGRGSPLHIREFQIPTPFSFPDGITAGPDGNLWFTEGFADKIGRITTAGEITEFPLTALSFPYGITAGPDGNLWFTEEKADKVGRITPAGEVTE